MVSKLRQYIRQILIKEVWGAENDYRIDYNLDLDQRRTIGMQDTDEVLKDREELQGFHQKLHSTVEGKAFIKSFVNGEAAIFHSITYVGYASSEGIKIRGDKDPLKPFSSWLKRNSNKKDQLSCVAANVILEPNVKISGDVNSHVITRGCGFVLKGYPVLASATDVMSQTLGALPQELIDHQKQSGIAKRGSTKFAYRNQKWHWAAEVLLDNWTVIGVYANQNMVTKMPPEVIEDMKSIGLPVYIFENIGMDSVKIKEIL